jgi:peptidoglycan/xylan/chitin deacetylase (PgdA/CDA1 family)
MSLLLWLMSLLLRGDQTQPAIASTAIAGVRTHEPVVALTFDACATTKQANGFDQQVFDIIARERIPATIYMTGTWAEDHPAAIRQIAAASFIEIGNHSYSHARLPSLPPARLRAQIDDANRILAAMLGRPPLSLRPPAGAWNRAVLLAAARAHLPVVLWTVVSGDAGGHVPPERMRRLVLEKTKSGAIVIFHINERGPFTKKVLPDVITGLRAQGFRFVTVSQLLSLPDAIPVNAPRAPLWQGRPGSGESRADIDRGEGASTAGSRARPRAQPHVDPARDQAAPGTNRTGSESESSSG